jgi:hypothetical protein
MLAELTVFASVCCLKYPDFDERPDWLTGVFTPAELARPAFLHGSRVHAYNSRFTLQVLAASSAKFV